MVNNLSTSNYLFTNANSQSSTPLDGDTPPTSSGLRAVAEGQRPDILFLTNSSEHVTGYATGGRIVDMPPDLQNKTVNELKTLAGTPSAAGYSSLPQILKDNNATIDTAPFSKAGEGTTAQFTIFTNGAGNVVGVDLPDGSGRFSLNPALNMAEFSRMVRAEGSPLSELSGKTFRTMETMATDQGGVLSFATLDGSAVFSPPAPRPSVAANPYLTPSTAAQLTSLLMEVASLKAKVSDKESQAILQTMTFMLNDAAARIQLNEDKADAEKLAASAKIVSAAMSIAGALTTIAGGIAAQKDYHAGKQKAGSMEVSKVDDGTPSPSTADQAARSRDQRNAGLQEGQDKADRERSDQRLKDQGGGTQGGLATARREDTGRTTSATTPMGDAEPTDDSTGSGELTLTSGDGGGTVAPAVVPGRSETQPTDPSAVSASPEPQPTTGRPEPQPTDPSAVSARPEPQPTDPSAVSARPEPQPTTGPVAGSGKPDAAKGTDGAGPAAGAGKTKGKEWDKDEAHDRRRLTETITDQSGRILASTGEMAAQAMTIASIEQRSTAEQREIMQQTFLELTRIVQQGQIGDQQKVDNEFKEILNLAKELMQKETEQHTALFQRM